MHGNRWVYFSYEMPGIDSQINIWLFGYCAILLNIPEFAGDGLRLND